MKVRLSAPPGAAGENRFTVRVSDYDVGSPVSADASALALPCLATPVPARRRSSSSRIHQGTRPSWALASDGGGSARSQRRRSSTLSRHRRYQATGQRVPGAVPCTSTPIRSVPATEFHASSPVRAGSCRWTARATKVEIPFPQRVLRFADGGFGQLPADHAGKRSTAADPHQSVRVASAEHPGSTPAPRRRRARSPCRGYPTGPQTATGSREATTEQTHASRPHEDAQPPPLAR